MALKLWSKLEDAGDVTAPQIGIGGAEVGSPTYVAAKFNNGILSDADSEGCTFPTAANSINLDKGTIEFWGKVNFPPADGSYHFLFDFVLADGTHGGVRLWFDKNKDDFEVQIRQGGATRVIATTEGLSWNSGDLLHFGVVWDREGNDIGDSKTVALYVNGVEEASSTTTWDTDTVGSDLYIGILATGSYHSDVVIDNIKIYDTCKIDFSDRDTEGVNEAPSAPTILQVDGKSTPTGANCVTTTPQFTAIYNDDSGDTSNAIEIEVGTASGLSDMWDSGWLVDATAEGNRCSAKTYAGAALSQGTSYWWRCRFRDDDNEEGAWSDWQQFDVCAAAAVVAEGGLLSQIW